MASSSLFLTAVLVLHALVSCAHGAVVKVCNGRLSYAECSNCCALAGGCMYLEPITGHPTCIGGGSRVCPRNCEGPKLMVCPSEASDAIGATNVEIVRGKLPPPETGCKYYNLKNGDFVPKMGEIQELEEKNDCQVDSLVQICNGEVSWENCGCCSGEMGCLFLENESANATCLPLNGVCPKICIPKLSVCSESLKLRGTTLEFCKNKRQTCEEMGSDCSLYDRRTGADKCDADALIKKYGKA